MSTKQILCVDTQHGIRLRVLMLVILAGTALTAFCLVNAVITNAGTLPITVSAMNLICFLTIIVYALFNFNKEDLHYKSTVHAIAVSYMAELFLRYKDAQTYKITTNYLAVFILEIISFGLLLVFAENLNHQKKAEIEITTVLLISLILVLLTNMRPVSGASSMLTCLTAVQWPILIGTTANIYISRCVRIENLK